MSEIRKQYGVIKVQIPTRELLVVPHTYEGLTVSHPAFGPNIIYENNVMEMRKLYTHPEGTLKMRFKEPTTSQSISAVGYEFPKRAKLQIFDKGWLQAGRIVRTSEGVIANPPRDDFGYLILDMNMLKKHIDKARKFNYLGANPIYLGDNDFGFAPYESFRTGVQDCDTFANGGLARIIENKNIAEKLSSIASPENYPMGVNVCGFESSEEPVKRVLTLGSSKYTDGDRLNIDGNECYGHGDNVNGFAFGVL